MTNNKQKKIGIGYYLSKHKWAVGFYVLFIILASVFDTSLILVLANAIAEITNAFVTQSSFNLGITLMLSCAGITIARRLCWFIVNKIYYKYSNLIIAEMSQDLTKQCFKLSSSTFSENNSGTFIKRILTDPASLIDKLSLIADRITETIGNAVVLIYIITLNWVIGLIILTMLISMMMFERLRQKIRKKNSTENKKISDKTYSLINEVVKSEKDIKALNLEGELFKVSKNSLDNLKKSNYKYNMTDCYFWSTRNLIVDLVSFVMLILGIFMLDKALITLATYILFYTYRNSLWIFVWNLGSVWENITEIKVLTKRMFNLFNVQIYPVDTFGSATIKNFKGKIEFKNVKFAYSELEEESEEEKKIRKKKKKDYVPKHNKQKDIFKNLSFVIQPNTTVAFVGKSGSGKSTILSIISKLYNVDSGTVLIDNKDIKTLSKETLRDNLSLINQFPYIFDMTIEENLKLVKEDASEDEIISALKRASFYEEVMKMPKGIKTMVGETGIKLSGGQRQRLAIARALLKNSKVIMFDESTSSLDNFAQSKIQNSIENLKGNHTVIIVAHRLSTIRNVDKIYFLEEGEIVDSGTFDELFNNNEKFKNMFLIENIEKNDNSSN